MCVRTLTCVCSAHVCALFCMCVYVHVCSLASRCMHVYTSVHGVSVCFWGGGGKHVLCAFMRASVFMCVCAPVCVIVCLRQKRGGGIHAHKSVA